MRLRYGAAVDSADAEDRDIAVALPTRDGAALLALARLRLAAQPPRAPVCGLAVSTMPVRPPEAQQLELLAPPGPRPPVPGRLLPALAQLAALCGEGRLGQPLRLSGHLPGLRGQAELSVQALLAPPGRTLRKDPPSDTPRPRRCAAHGVNPPRPARVERRGNALAWVRADGIDGEVLCTGGPFLRRRGPLAATRLYYDVEVRGSGVLRLFCEGEDWFLDARYE